jgi:DnaJ family protein C protein 1
VLHPDKNSAEDANIVFRNLVSVYEVLKDSGKREKYDKVLKEGLPTWRSMKYYYRKARKVGLMESAIIILVITTICQYFISWAVYLEKKFTMEQMLSKKGSKKKKANLDTDAILKEIPKPSIRNTLPFQIPMGIYYAITGTPSAIKESINMVSEFTKKELERKQK